MGIEHIKDFDAAEVGMWLTCMGLGAKAPKFIEEGVDGALLLDLSKDDLMNDLDLSSLQAKKVLKNIEFTKTLCEGGGDVNPEEVEALKKKVEELEGRVGRRDATIAELKAQIEEMQTADIVVEAEPEPVPEPEPAPAPAPEPVAAPAPPPESHSHQSRGRRGPGVVGGAATGAAGGAVKGAIIGAIVPGMEASDGAAAGAAVGALGGGMRGLRGRRRR